MLSQEAKYALKTLIVLANEDRPCSVQQVAEAEGIPKRFLEQILIRLRRAGIVDSIRGRNGGYRLSRPATEIPASDVIRTIDGPLAPLPCLSKTRYQSCIDCTRESECHIRRMFEQVARSARAVLENTSLADMAGKDTP